LRKSPK